MDAKTRELLEEAVDRYVDGLDLETLVYLVSEDIYAQYIKNATDQEVQEFIEEMQVEG
jgi:hypothetical protein